MMADQFYINPEYGLGVCVCVCVCVCITCPDLLTGSGCGADRGKPFTVLAQKQ